MKTQILRTHNHSQHNANTATKRNHIQRPSTSFKRDPHLRVPKPPPITVVLSPPPPLVFAADDTHTLLPSYDIPDVIDPATTPLVATTDKLPSTPAAALQTIDVSDTQPVPSAPLRPTRPAALYLQQGHKHAPQPSSNSTIPQMDSKTQATQDKS